MTTSEVETRGRLGTLFEPATANTIGGASFALWGLIHVVVGAIGMGIFFTGGTAPVLEFVHIDAAANEQAARMAVLVVEFYQALALIGLTAIIVGVTLNRRGEPVGLAINAILVASIEAFFIWFEVLPGHRPVAVGVVTVALLVLGIVFCGFGIRR